MKTKRSWALIVFAAILFLCGLSSFIDGHDGYGVMVWDGLSGRLSGVSMMILSVVIYITNKAPPSSGPLDQ